MQMSAGDDPVGGVLAEGSHQLLAEVCACKKSDRKMVKEC